MDAESFCKYCLDKKGVTEDFPFDEETLVFKVLGKIFVLTHIDTFESINLKCDPERAMELRERYEEIRPGYHMNKKHWNTVMVNGSLGDEMLKELIDHSYDRVVAGLPAKLRKTLEK